VKGKWRSGTLLGTKLRTAGPQGRFLWLERLLALMTAEWRQDGMNAHGKQSSMDKKELNQSCRAYFDWESRSIQSPLFLVRISRLRTFQREQIPSRERVIVMTGPDGNKRPSKNQRPNTV
jgi:hypothetical protein